MRSLSALSLVLLHLQPISAQSISIFEPLHIQQCTDAVHYAKLAIQAINDPKRPRHITELLSRLFAPRQLYDDEYVKPKHVQQTTDLDLIRSRLQTIVNTLKGSVPLSVDLYVGCRENNLPSEAKSCLEEQTFAYTLQEAPVQPSLDSAFRVMIFCPMSLEKQPKTMEDIPDAKPGTFIGEVIPFGLTVLHEFFHAIFNVRDLAFNFADCVDLTKGEFKQRDPKTGQLRRGSQANNPESYVLFAATLSENAIMFDWTEGAAKPVPGPPSPTKNSTTAES